MGKYTYVLLILFKSIINIYGRWDQEITCPVSCTCRLEHLTDMAIYRFTKEPIQTDGFLFEEYNQNNEVIYNDDDLKSNFDGNLLRAVTCMIQSHMEMENLIDKLPYDTNYLSIIQGFNAGNKTIKFGDLQDFSELTILEIQGSKLKNTILILDIDESILSLKYLNLENIVLKSTKQNQTHNNKAIGKMTFEYVQQLDSNLHPLRIVSENTGDRILPYNKYKENIGKTQSLTFSGCNNLVLLRIYDCDLNNIHWEMFERLNNLQYLLLQRNNIKFIPDFAFYGTPNLRLLSLSHNNLLNIQITDLAGLLELEYLDLSFNNFTKLSELSFPPFPKLQLADFGNNPISVIFPNTFDVMNTTDSLILGGIDIPLSLQSNSFVGLNLLKKLTLQNVHVYILKRDLLIGMPQLIELTISGNVPEIEFDTFLDSNNIEKLVLSHCRLSNVSMDSFMGLENLKYLDLSNNLLNYLPPGIFDQLYKLTELLLNNNKFTNLERGVLLKVPAKLIRLTQNPWHCSCLMSEWKPIIINKKKQKTMEFCDYTLDKGVNCRMQSKIQYIYDNRMAPKCATPNKFKNWSVFHVMRKQLQCPEYKPKIKKIKVSVEKNKEVLKQTSFNEKLLYSKVKINEIAQNNIDTNTDQGNNYYHDSNKTNYEDNEELNNELSEFSEQQNVKITNKYFNNEQKLTAKAQYKLQMAKLNKLRKNNKQY